MDISSSTPCFEQGQLSGPTHLFRTWSILVSEDRDSTSSSCAVKPQHRFPMIKPRDPQNQVSTSTAGSPPRFLLWFWLGFLNVGQDDSPKGEVPWIIPESGGRGAFMAPHGFYWEKLFTTHRSLLIWLETHAKWSFGDQDSNLAGKHPYLLSSQPVYNPLQWLVALAPNSSQLSPSQPKPWPPSGASFRCSPICQSALSQHSLHTHIFSYIWN